MLKKALWTVVVFFSLGIFATAQDDGHFDASIGWGGVFNKTSSNAYSAVTVAPTNSGVVLGTFQVRFNRMHGLELNIGHTKNSQVYILGSNDYRVEATVIEYSGAYVFSPFQTRKLEPFLLGGQGGLRCNPGNTYIDGFQSAFGASRQWLQVT